MAPKQKKTLNNELTKDKNTNTNIKKNSKKKLTKEESDISDSEESKLSENEIQHKGGKSEKEDDEIKEFDENDYEDEEELEDEEEDKEDKEEDKEEDKDEDKDDDAKSFTKIDEGKDDDGFDDEDCVYNNIKKSKNGDDEDEELDDEDDFFEEESDNKNIYVSEEDRITTRKLTKYERVNVLGTRAKQIELGAQRMVKNTKGLKPKEIAKLELKMKVCPIIIKRTLPSGLIEKIDVNTLKVVN